MYGGGRDAGAGSNFGSENFGGNQGKNNYSSKTKTKTKAQKTYSILSNIVQGLSKMVTVGRQKNSDVKANNALFGTSDYQGDVKKADFSTPGNDGDNNNNTPIIIKKNIGGNTIQTTAPTAAEVSQSEAANADAAALKVKKRGRSASILTSAKGVTGTSSNYSLGKKSLLGRI